MSKLMSICLLMAISGSAFGQDSTVIHLWPGKVPGESRQKHSAVVTDDHSKSTTRLTDVTDPVMTVFRPKKAKANGKAVLVCPGGGYKILAIDLEGYEIAHWLNGLGITAFVLQYRVPDKQEGALQDAQRAIRLIRKNASRWRIDPDSIGIMGFSAGGSLSARLSCNFNKATYAPIDDADQLSARPAFTLLIYPAYLDKGPDQSLTPELTLSADTPPMFLFQTADDPYGHSSLVMAAALQENKTPVEQHLYPEGRHGYGLREDNPAGKIWPVLAARWLQHIPKP